MISLTPQTVFEQRFGYNFVKLNHWRLNFCRKISSFIFRHWIFSLYIAPFLSRIDGCLDVMENQHLVKKNNESACGLHLRETACCWYYWKTIPKTSRALFGKTMLKVLLKRLRTGLPEPQIALRHDRWHKLSDNHTKKPVFIVRNIQKIVTCECCRKIFYNDRRRICCDQCKSLSRYEKNRSRKLREVNFKMQNSILTFCGHRRICPFITQNPGD